MRCLAPAIGSLFEYEGSKYRVTLWVKPELEPAKEDIFSWILWKASQSKMIACVRSEATHVCGAGIAGCMAPIEEIKVTGMVDWPEEHLKQDHEFALRLVGEQIGW